MLLIIVNTGVLASHRYDEGEEVHELKKKLDYFFVAAFTVELILKLIGLGPKTYFHDSVNIFDASLVLVSLVEFVLAFNIDAP